jgi:hypothetical protein
MSKRKRAKRPRRPRFATLAYYGPNDQRASKLVAAVFNEGQEEPLDLRRWVSGRSDVRKDEKIGREVMSFLRRHGVNRVAGLGRIIGCPHEEGLDYPEGEKCPFCPFLGQSRPLDGRDRRIAASNTLL